MGWYLTGRINVSLNHPAKERRIAVYGSRGTLLYDGINKPHLQFMGYEVQREKSWWPQSIEHGRYPDFSENELLAEAVNYFYLLLNGRISSNIDDAVLITSVVENLKPSYSDNFAGGHL